MTEMTRLQQRGVRLPRTERRAQLLAAAQRVFAENGYHAAAMDEIAEVAGVSKATVGAFFDFVNNDAGAFRMVFESDLRGEPSVQEAVDRATSASVDAITETITADAGLDEDKARLLAVGLVGMSQVSARFWLQHHQSMSREEAVALTANLAWRGIGGGFPLKDA